MATISFQILFHVMEVLVRVRFKFFFSQLEINTKLARHLALKEAADENFPGRHLDSRVLGTLSVKFITHKTLWVRIYMET